MLQNSLANDANLGTKSPVINKKDRFKNAKSSLLQKLASPNFKLEMEKQNSDTPLKIEALDDIVQPSQPYPQNQNGVSIQQLKIDDKDTPTNLTNNNNSSCNINGGGTSKGRIHSVFRSSMMTVHTSSSDKSRKKEEPKNEDDTEEEKKLNSLFFALGQLTEKQRFEKAIRHFRDCLSLNPVRHDIELCESNLMRQIYYWQTSAGWQNFLFLIGIIYPMISFVEPANHHVTDYLDNTTLIYFETPLIAFVWIDILLEIFHLFFDKDRSFFQHYIINYVLSTRVLIGITLLVDCVLFHSNFPSLTYRFSRYVRPFLVFYYSNELRRTLISILKSLQKITQLILFIFVLTLFFAVIGWRFIGDLDGAADPSKLESDFSGIISSANIVYSLISFDNYPDCMLPAYNSSSMFSAFFIIYCILLVLLFVPIPVSVVYEAFRGHRSKLVLTDRILQREALFSCFITLDFKDSKAIEYDQFKKFMIEVYLHRKTSIKRIRQLYLNLDKNDSKSIQMNEFFDIIDVLEKNPQFQIPIFPDYKLWDKLRSFANKKLYLKAISKSNWFTLLMVLILAGNCTVLFISMTSNDQSQIDLCDSFDDYFYYTYVAEMIIKLIGLGIEKYFDDSWNVFDFAMVVLSTLSLALSTTLSFLKSAKSAKATKLLRLTKVNKLFRIFKALRSIKFLNLLFSGAELFYQVKLLVQKILMCLPIVIRLIPVNLMLMYIYTYIALETFNTDTFAYNPGSPYDSGYANFTSFSDSLLIFFQITLEASWSQYIYDNIFKFGSPMLTRAIFVSFDFITQFILLSLIKGIVWEVFTVVNEEIKIHEASAAKRSDSMFLKLQNINKLLFLKPIEVNNEEGSPLNKLLIKRKRSTLRKPSAVYPLPNSLTQAITSSLNQKSFSIISQITATSTTQFGSISSDLRGIMMYEDILKALITENPNQKGKLKEEKHALSNSKFQPVKALQEEEEEEEDINKSKVEIIKEAPKFKPIGFTHSRNGSSNAPPPPSIQTIQNQDLDEQSKNQEEIQPQNDDFGIIVNQSKGETINDNSKETAPTVKKSIYKQLNIKTNLLKQAGEKTTNSSQRNNSKNCASSSSDENSVHSEVNLKNPLIQHLQNSSGVQKSLLIRQSTNNSQSEMPEPTVDLKKQQNDYIFWLRRHIKPFSFLVKKQLSSKRSLDGYVNFNEEFVLSDDEESVQEYEKQMDAFIFEEESEKAAEEKLIQEGVDDMGQLNFQYMMKRALLKDSNLDLVKKLEIDYFQSSYGNFFNSFNITNLNPLLRYESFLIYNLQRALRHKALNMDFFFQVIVNLEANLSATILRKGSLAKILFQDSEGNWVSLKEINKKVYPCLLGQGPWSFYDTVFNQEQELFVSRDFFVLNQNKTMQNLIFDFYSELRTCARCIDRDHSFLGINPEYAIYDFYSMFIENKKEEAVVADVIKAQLKQANSMKNQENKNQTEEKTPKDIEKNVQNQDSSSQQRIESELSLQPKSQFNISNNNNSSTVGNTNTNAQLTTDALQVPIFGKKIMIMILSYIGESETEKKEDKRRQSTHSNQEKKEARFSEIFLEHEQESPKTIRQTKQNSIKQLNMDEINKKQAKDKDKISDQSTLPMGFIVDMIQNLADILQLHSHNLFFQFSSLLNQKLRSENYFNKIINENITEVEKLKNQKEKIQKKTNEIDDKNKNIFKKMTTKH